MASIRRAWAHHSMPCIGYRALSVDFSENGKFGKNGIDTVLHGPIMGVTFRW